MKVTKKKTVATAKLAGSLSCELYSTVAQTCPLCQAKVPARRTHKCSRVWP